MVGFGLWRTGLVLLVCGACGGNDTTSSTQQAATTCIDIVASADTTVSNPPMHLNFGDDGLMRVGGKHEALLRFELGAIPENAIIDSAALRVFVSKAGDETPINAHRVTTTWTEPTVTFASFAQQFDPAVAGSLVVTDSNTQKSIDLRGLVTNWLVGVQPNHGLLLESDAKQRTVVVSREGGTAAQRPALHVCYSQALDHCAPNPCQHGNCENEATGFTCHCPPGYDGPLCEQDVDDCAANPCLNGATCVDALDGYTCTCSPGFSGTYCETDIDDCATNPCANGGVCDDGVASFVCYCLPGYTGSTCGELIDNCAGFPCLNGGLCSNQIGGFSCSCPTGFAGATCEIDIDDCQASPCHNGGTCIDGIASYECACAPDWGGPQCDVNLNSCGQHPCLNGAGCTNVAGSYACTCAPGFAGANCEIDIDECAGAPCPEDEICIDRVDGYSCSCDRPAVCTSFAGSEGRCLPSTSQHVSAVMPVDICAVGERCAPCFDPTSPNPLQPTGVCSVGCDSPTTEPITLSCPWNGPPVIDPTQQPACGCAGAHCVGSAYVPQTMQPLLEPCAVGLCAPDSMIATAGNTQPIPCKPFATTNAGADQGRCISTCVRTAWPTHLTEGSSCEANQTCLPCWDPVSGAETGACSVSSCDAPPTTKFRFPKCCGGVGICTPTSLIPDGSEESLQQQDCPTSGYLCTPGDTFPGAEDPRQCHVDWAIFDFDGYDGRCVADCFIESPELELVPSGGCPLAHSCVPLY